MTTTFGKRLRLYGAVYVAWLLVLFVLTGGLLDFPAWVHGWMKWDSSQYFRLWKWGYRPPEWKAVAFPPGYALLVGTLSEWLHVGFHAMGRFINMAAYFGSLVLLCEVMLGLGLVSAPLFFFLLALTSPTAYYVYTAYSDMVFALLLWGAVYLALLHPASKKARIGEFCLLLLVPWIRLTGYALASWIIFRRWPVAGIFLSLAGWLGLNYYLTGDALHFIRAQELYAMAPGTIIDGARGAFRGFFNPPDSWTTKYLQFKFLPALYFLTLAATGVWFCLGKQRLIGVTILAVLLLSHNQSFWRSVVRYDLPLMPCLFVPLLYYMREKAANWQTALCAIIGAVQFALQLHFANLCKLGHWTF